MTQSFGLTNGFFKNEHQDEMNPSRDVDGETAHVERVDYVEDLDNDFLQPVMSKPTVLGSNTRIQRIQEERGPKVYSEDKVKTEHEGDYHRNDRWGGKLERVCAAHVGNKNG